MSYRTAGDRSLMLRTSRPGGQTVVIEVSGCLDSNTATRFAELMRNRLSSTAHTVVLDLSSLSFISTDGVVVLLEASHRALIRAVSLVLITGNEVVDRLLGVLDLADEFTYADTVEEVEEVEALEVPGPRIGEPRATEILSPATEHAPSHGG